MEFLSYNRFILIAGLLMCAFNSHAHFISMETWNKHDPKTEKSQTIVLVSDIHRSDKNNAKSINKQREDLVNIAKQLNGVVIVEDGMIYGDDLIYSASVNMHQGTFTKDKLKNMEIETPLHGLHSLCTIEGVPSKNVEYRFSSFRPLDIYHQFFQNKKHQIKFSYNDGPLFKQYYKDRIEQLEQLIEVPLKPIFDLLKNNKSTLGEFLKRKDLPTIKNIDEIFKKIENRWNISSIDYPGKISIMLTNYGAAFLDMEIMHAIASYGDHELIFVCAGDMHIQAIKKALIDIGYEPKEQQGDALRLLQGKKYNEPNALDVNKTIAQFSLPKNVPQYKSHSLSYSLFKIAQNSLTPLNMLYEWWL